MDDLDVQVQGTRIQVTEARTDCAVTYEKHPDLRILVVTQSRVNRSAISPDFCEFHARAFRSALDKARELGWTV
jgi:hypothetical protein